MRPWAKVLIVSGASAVGLYTCKNPYFSYISFPYFISTSTILATLNLTNMHVEYKATESKPNEGVMGFNTPSLATVV